VRRLPDASTSCKDAQNRSELKVFVESTPNTEFNAKLLLQKRTGHCTACLDSAQGLAETCICAAPLPNPPQTPGKKRRSCLGVLAPRFATRSQAHYFSPVYAAPSDAPAGRNARKQAWVELSQLLKGDFPAPCPDQPNSASNPSRLPLPARTKSDFGF
jgi:hypothetical protein